MSGGGGNRGGLSLPLPVPFNPGSRPAFCGSRPFAFFRLRNIAQCCVLFPFFSRFPPPWESRFPPPLLSPPVHLLLPFLPVSRPPVPPPPPPLMSRAGLAYRDDCSVRYYMRRASPSTAKFRSCRVKRWLNQRARIECFSFANPLFWIWTSAHKYMQIC